MQESKVRNLFVDILCKCVGSRDLSYNAMFIKKLKQN